MAAGDQMSLATRGRRRYPGRAEALALVLVLVGPSGAHAVDVGKNITVTGTLQILKAPAETTGSEREEKYPAILLDNPMPIECASSEDFCESQTAVAVMQLVLDNDAEWRAFKKLKGKKATLSGTTFGSENGNHYTDFLLDVESIRKLK